MRKSSRLTPGTVSMRPSKEACNWNSLKRHALTHPVVERERPTYNGNRLTLRGVTSTLQKLCTPHTINKFAHFFVMQSGVKSPKTFFATKIHVSVSFTYYDIFFFCIFAKRVLSDFSRKVLQFLHFSLTFYSIAMFLTPFTVRFVFLCCVGKSSLSVFTYACKKKIER